MNSLDIEGVENISASDLALFLHVEKQPLIDKASEMFGYHMPREIEICKSGDNKLIISDCYLAELECKMLVAKHYGNYFKQIVRFWTLKNHSSPSIKNNMIDKERISSILCLSDSSRERMESEWTDNYAVIIKDLLKEHDLINQ